MDGVSGGASPGADQKKSYCPRVPWATVLSYLGLYSVTVAYLFLGGLVFYLLEHLHEEDIKTRVIVLREDFLQLLLSTSVVNVDPALNWTDTARELILDYEGDLQIYWKQGWRSHIDNKWGYLSACFYCLTVVSTIGYGHITPTTQMGRLATVFYAILGIPLFFLFLAKAGDLVSIPLRYINSIIIKSCKNCPGCESCTGLDSVSRFGSSLSIFSTGIRPSIKPEDVENSGYDEAEDAGVTDSHDEPTHSYLDIPGVPDNDDDEDDDAVLCRVEDWTTVNQENLTTTNSQEHLPTTTAWTQTDPSLFEHCPISHKESPHRRGNGMSSVDTGGKSVDVDGVTSKDGESVVVSDAGSKITRRKDGYPPPRLNTSKDEQVEVPISILLLLQLTYLLGGAAFLNASQDWTFIDSLYFSTTTFTTVGFGDLIPFYDDHAENILQTTWFMSIYIVIGLILMASCINLAMQRIVRFTKVVMKGCCRSRRCRDLRRCCRQCCR